MSQVVVYMTASDTEEAARIGRMLVERRLAACVNVLGPIRSFYLWDGAVQDDPEVAFIAKTEDDRVAELTEAVTAAHSYDVPCVVALPVAGGHAEFLAWLRDETRPPRTV